MSNRFDDIFRDQLRDHNTAPPPRVWTDMVDDLPMPIPFYKQPAFVISSSITSLVFLALLSYFFLAPHSNTIQENSPSYTPSNNSEYTYSLLPSIAKVDRPKPQVAPAIIAMNNKPSIDIASSQQANRTEESTSLLAADTQEESPVINSFASYIIPSTSKNTSSQVALLSTTKGVASHVAPQTSPDNPSKSTSQVAPRTSHDNPSILQTLNPSKSTSHLAPRTSHDNPSVLQSLSPSVPPYYPSVEIEQRDRRLPQASNVIESIVEETSTTVDEPIVSATIINATSKDQPIKRTVTAVTPLSPIADPINNTQTILATNTTEETLTERPISKEDKLPRMANANKLYFGTFGSVNNTWLLANKGLSAAVNNKGLDQMLDFGHSYGFVVGYDITKNFGLQAEWVLKSHQGQKFTTYNPQKGARQYETDINLIYTQFPVLLKYRRSRYSGLTNQPVVVNWTAGVQYGVLRSAGINADNPIFQEDLLKQSSWGWVLGVDYDIYFNKNYFLSLGARSSLSTTSDSFAQMRFPGANRTNNLLIGLRAGLNYRFNK